MTIKAALKDISQIDFRVVPIEILPRLKADLDQHRFSGPAGHFIKDHYMHYDFDMPPGYGSILVVSYAQPHAQVRIDDGGGVKYVAMPSGYYNQNFADRLHHQILDALVSGGIEARLAHLPLKLLGARSGLCQYGKNNISYVKTFGSQHRLVAFYTGAGIEEATEGTLAPWHEDIFLEACKHCQACVQACPYGAISDTDGLIDPNKCLSFYMDLLDPLPPWVKEARVEALIGCTHCQDACSLNCNSTPNTREILATISKDQVDEIRAVDHYENLSPSTRALVHTLGFDDSYAYALFKRNMGVL